ncbi:CRM-domain containing factor CFM3, chloroplastic/mitochondrial isoform X2 [Cryptomeria japonica]|nr:CRM-domain containing factor CFM3, chloroplastic/mitochondrial isoform X2 [Cryptomeria japonica]
MSFTPACPRWPLSALHSLASSTHCNGACLQMSISPCLLTAKPKINKQICTDSSYNVNKQKTYSNNPRHLSDKFDRLLSDRDSRQKQKYPWRSEEEESEKLPWQKEGLSPKKHNGPYSLKNPSRDNKKTGTLRDKQNTEFNSSRGRPPFGNGPIMPTAPWMQGWSNVPIKDTKKKAEKSKVDLDSENDDLGQVQHFDGGKRKTAMHRIVNRLRNLSNIEEARKRDRDDSSSNSPEETYFAEKKIMPSNNIGTLLEKSWGDTDQEIQENGKGSMNIPLPWERINAIAKSAKPERENRVKTPTLAELTVPDAELKRLRTLGIRLKERINVPKAGLTQNVLDKIHDQWRTSELVRLKFDEPLSENMKRAHQLSEDKTGGFVIWRAGSALVLYRGSNYEPPSVRAARAQAKISSGVGILVADNKPFVPDTKSAYPVTRRKTSDVLNGDASSRLLDACSAASAQLGHEIITNEAQLIPSIGKLDPEKEINSILDGLGPRFIDWWGNDPLPVDADLLPEVVPNYKTPFRLLPYGTKRSKLSNSEMTNLRMLARPLPIHFALGRNRRLQGLAAAIVKLWERSEIAKIAVKRGVQNTNNKLMSEEIKELTGGILLLRNKYFIIIYRGKDFLPPLVANVLAEKTAEAKVFQDDEEDARLRAAAAVQARADMGTSLAGTLAETLEARARWGTECEDPQKTRAAAAEAKKAEAERKLQQKIAIAQLKKQKAEKELSKLEAFLSPAEPPEDRETITNEERFMFRRLGLRMNAFLPLGRRGVFDGVVENMHLHWKHRELVKIISKGNSFACIEDIARTLEAESGGILVTVERVSKGYAMIFYRGKNYQRPTNLRPQNLLNKRKALKRSLENQRKESLSFHIYQLEQNIKQLKLDLNKADYVDEGTHAPDSNSELETEYSYTFLETDDEESDSEHFYSYSENEDTSSGHDSEMDAVEAVQKSEPETGLQDHMSKEFDPIFSG